MYTCALFSRLFTVLPNYILYDSQAKMLNSTLNCSRRITRTSFAFSLSLFGAPVRYESRLSACHVCYEERIIHKWQSVVGEKLTVNKSSLNFYVLNAFSGKVKRVLNRLLQFINLYLAPQNRKFKRDTLFEGKLDFRFPACLRAQGGVFSLFVHTAFQWVLYSVCSLCVSLITRGWLARTPIYLYI